MTRAGIHAGARRPILIIEDEPSVTAFLRAVLQRHGYLAVPAASGAEGLRLLADGNYLGVISDIRMPGGANGADVHAWIRSHQPELSSRLILITGDTANRETFELLERSGTPCVEKPFRAHELIAVVEKVLGKP